MFKVFRVISAVEGISLLCLLFIAMPAKYYFGRPELVSYVGMAHGILWLLYLLTAFVVSHMKAWPLGRYLWVLVASILPFGFVLFEYQQRRQESYS